MGIEEDPCGLLADAVKDPDSGKYMHLLCGEFLIGKRVHLTVRALGEQGLKRAGTGEVVTIIQPACLECGIEPDAYGEVKLGNTPAAVEGDIIEDL